ncbi:unnamed protein product [Candidula unifasciata]|uniref:Small integral membrane protein 4 n=1 Tax=Candidula unifasciata TaxID=100452 RepID=A0A8S3Z2B7_9EUPU|nr:unnamed protein product [Candidula unifasciata]
MAKRIKIVQLLIDKWPGKQTFGIYRFMPLFFLVGAAMEFAMINWKPLGVNFYEVYKEKEAKKLAERALKSEAN